MLKPLLLRESLSMMSAASTNRLDEVPISGVQSGCLDVAGGRQLLAQAPMPADEARQPAQPT